MKLFLNSVRKIKKYGWKRGNPDHRDYKFTPALGAGALPANVNLTDQCPAISDQGNLGSCTAFAIGALVEFLEMKGNHTFTPSRLFIYYNERVLEGTVRYDSGATIRDGMKVVNKLGAPHENLWPYNINKFKLKPKKAVYKDAALHKAIQYMAVDQNLNSMRSCLAEGFPIVVGFSVYESFESNTVTNTGVVPMPNINEQVLGGHAVLVVGYDDTNNWFIVRNSWGEGWGVNGYFYMPYEYLTDTNLSSDFWTMQSIS